MSTTFNRRSLLQGALVAAAVPTTSMAAEADAAARIFGMLQLTLGLDESARALMGPFVASLQTPDKHTESPETFAHYLAAHDSYELAAYVLEEFVISSNYLAVQVGEERELRLVLDSHF